MHEITVYETEYRCSCGVFEETTHGSEALRLAYIHARANTPASVKDTRHINHADL